MGHRVSRWDSTHGGRSHPAPPHVGRGPRPLRAGQATSGLGGPRAHPPHAAARSAPARDGAGCPSLLSYAREGRRWSVWGPDTARPLALLQPRVEHGVGPAKGSLAFLHDAEATTYRMLPQVLQNHLDLCVLPMSALLCQPRYRPKTGSSLSWCLISRVMRRDVLAAS